MMKALSILLLLLTSHIAFAQIAPFDTTLKVNDGLVYISSKNLGSNNVLLTATIGSKATLVDTIDKLGLANIKFPDVNNDGYADIMTAHLDNNMVYNLYLFDPKTKVFRHIKDYANYPQAIQLKPKSNYYYSYHRAGCADLNWASDLFKIIDFKIVQVGHMDGFGCTSNEEQPALEIKIYKINNNDEEKAKLIKTLPYLKHIKDVGAKWHFIATYWHKILTSFD